MEQAQHAAATGITIGTTALGRLHMRVREDEGYKEVIVERRWADLTAARAWCERAVEHAAADTAVLEIQVFEETWQHGRSWETTGSRPIAHALQLGVVPQGGAGVMWSERRPMSPHGSARHAR
jgi:hypothetical protein